MTMTRVLWTLFYDWKPFFEGEILCLSRKHCKNASVINEFTNSAGVGVVAINKPRAVDCCKHFTILNVIYTIEVLVMKKDKASEP